MHFNEPTQGRCRTVICFNSSEPVSGLLYAGIGLLTLVGGSFVALNVASLFGENMTPVEVERTQVIMWLLTFNLATFLSSIPSATNR